MLGFKVTPQKPALSQKGRPSGKRAASEGAGLGLSVFGSRITLDLFLSKSSNLETD